MHDQIVFGVHPAFFLMHNLKVRRSEGEADHSPLYSDGVKNVRTFTFVPSAVWRTHGFILMVIVTGWYRTTRPMHCCHFFIYCASPSEF
jgi:hypothetical protein